MAKKEKKMTREEALQLYQDLQSSVSAIMKGKAPKVTAKPKSDQSNAERQMFEEAHPAAQRDRGAVAAVTFVLFCGMVKLGVSLIDYIGVFEAPKAQASMNVQPISGPRQITAQDNPTLSPEEIKLLTSLDARRVALEDRSKALDAREQDISKRDKDYVLKLTELRELTEKLRLEREKDDKKKSLELDQLANIYGSMAPQEAAHLIEQLDVTIALPLLKRMPEKRMGQILPMMTAEKALAITKLLSGSR